MTDYKWRPVRNDKRIRFPMLCLRWCWLPTLRDSLKAAKLLLVSRLLSRLRDLFRWRGTLRVGVNPLSPLVRSDACRSGGCSSATISRLLRRMPRPTHGREPRLLDANRYLAFSTLDLKLIKNQSIINQSNRRPTKIAKEKIMIQMLNG